MTLERKDRTRQNHSAKTWGKKYASYISIQPNHHQSNPSQGRSHQHLAVLIITDVAKDLEARFSAEDLISTVKMFSQRISSRCQVWTWKLQWWCVSVVFFLKEIWFRMYIYSITYIYSRNLWVCDTQALKLMVLSIVLHKQVTSVPSTWCGRVAECPTPNLFKQHHAPQRCWMVLKLMLKHLAFSFWMLNPKNKEKRQDKRQHCFHSNAKTPWVSPDIIQRGTGWTASTYESNRWSQAWSTGYVLPICRIWWRYIPKSWHVIGKTPCWIGTQWNTSLFKVVVPFSFASFRRNLHTRKNNINPMMVWQMNLWPQHLREFLVYSR